MSQRAVFASGILVLALAAVSAYGQSNIQTADVSKRGLTDTDFPRRIKLADNVYAFEMLAPVNAARGGGQERYTTNSMIVITTDGVLVADGQGSVAEVNRLTEEIRKLTDQPIKYVVVCSEHPDHSGGNSAFPANATFVSHPATKLALERQANAPNRPATAPKIVVPGETVADTRVIRMGNTEIQVRVLGRSHTGGDLTVYLPNEKILWLSETFNHRRFPTLSNGYPSEWVSAIDRAQKMDVTFYLGAHGFVDDPGTMRTELGEYRKALETVIAEAKRLYRPGTPWDDAFKQANFGAYASWTTASVQAPLAFRRAWDELDGKVK